MKGKVLIVEDEPIVALDLKQEVENLGCEVVGVAESAEEALAATDTHRPDLVLMDIRIVGSLDGIQTARVLRNWYQVPSIFLTSYSDERTIARAAREMPYGYLTKPFQSAELKAALRVALHKSKVDARERAAHQEVAATIAGMREAVITIDNGGTIRFMNQAAEKITRWTLTKAQGKPMHEILPLTDTGGRPLAAIASNTAPNGIEGFGWNLEQAGGSSLFVDFNYAPLTDGEGEQRGFILTLRDASERMRIQALEECEDEHSNFEQSPTAMVQLDPEGRILRVNQALLKGSGVTAESLVRRSLTGLRLDPDPRIAQDLIPKLLADSSFMAAIRGQEMN